MNNILLPTDFSNNSLVAAQFAAKYLSNEHSRFIFIHVYNLPRGGTSGLFYLLDELREQATKDMDAYMIEIKKQIPEINDNNSESSIRQGDFDDVCNAVAEEKDVDYILVGTKGSSGIKEVLVGSNTLRMMKSLKRPLYAIPEDSSKYKLEELIVSYDGKDLKDESVSVIQKTASVLKLPICLLHIRINEDDPIQNLDEINKLFEGFSLNLKESWGSSYEEGLKKGLEGQDALLILIRHKQSFWENLFNLSDSRSAVMQTELPMLIIPEN